MMQFAIYCAVRGSVLDLVRAAKTPALSAHGLRSVRVCNVCCKDFDPTCPGHSNPPSLNCHSGVGRDSAKAHSFTLSLSPAPTQTP